MNWKPKVEDDYRISIVNCTMLAKPDEERCKFCGRYGCTDRGYTVVAGAPPTVFAEAALAWQVIEKIEEHSFLPNWLKDYFHVESCSVDQCVRKLKKTNAKAVLEKMQACNGDCRRNGNPCAFRDGQSVCQRNVNPDGSTLVCQPDDEYYFDCPFHEQSFSQCYRREKDQCSDLLEKFDAPGNKDLLLLLSHRFSAASCRFCKEGTCGNEASLHYEGICCLDGLMATCEQYAPIDTEGAFTEGVCTYVSSKDGKDNRKIFPSSNYADELETDVERFTLCTACRISYSIAKATGLKCLGVRRSATNPFLNKENPLAKHAIQINYLYLTHPEDVAQYDPNVLAKAVFDALTLNCEGLGCEEYPMCNFNPK
jgi:hypothetical protein